MSTWHVTEPGEPVACPTCQRAQDRAGPDTFVRVRLIQRGDVVAAGSLERICRNVTCQSRLEVQPCPTTARQ